MALTDNLSAYYKLDGNANDSTANGNNGTATNVTYVAGKIGDCASFAGTGKIATFSPNIGTGDFTIGCWFNTTNAASRKFLMSSNNGGYYTQLDAGFIAGNQIGFEIYANNLYHTVDFADGNRHFIVGTRVGGNMYLYYDGTQVQSGGVTSDAGNSQMVIGGRPYDNNGLFTGKIDEAFVYVGKGLSSTEVTSLYNSGAGLTYPFASPANNTSAFFRLFKF